MGTWTILIKVLADKVDKCLLNQGCYVLFAHIVLFGMSIIYGVVGVCYSGVSNCIEVNGRRLSTVVAGVNNLTLD